MQKINSAPCAFHAVAAGTLAFLHFGYFLNSAHGLRPTAWVCLAILCLAHATLIYLAVLEASSLLEQRILRRSSRVIVVGALLFLLVILFSDAVAYRHMAVHPIRMLLRGLQSRTNFREFLDNLSASNVKFSHVLRLLSEFLLVFVVVFGLVQALLSRLQVRSLRLRLAGKMGVICLSLLAIFLEQTFGDRWIPSDIFSAQRHVLPWFLSLAKPSKGAFALRVSIHHFGKDYDSEEALKRYSISTSSPRPNVFFFIIDGLRNDVINPKVTPNLVQFGRENPSPTYVVSPSNLTIYSFFSIFYSRHSIYRPEFLNSDFKHGSLALRLLKRAGYHIHYWGSLGGASLERLIFGEDSKLANSVESELVSPYESRARCDERHVSETVKLAEAQGHDGSGLYIDYLTSSHWVYGWPSYFSPPFTPFMENMDELNWSFPTPDRQKVFNRYLNSVHYSDELFGQLIKGLKSSGLYDNALIFVIGDHGEEFLEHGLIGHGGELCETQLRVPLLVHFGNYHLRPRATASTIDIFPTVLDLVGIKPTEGSDFDGVSLTKPGNKLIESDMSGDQLTLRTPDFTATAYLDGGWRVSDVGELEIQKIEDSRGNRLPFWNDHQAMRRYYLSRTASSLQTDLRVLPAQSSDKGLANN